MTREEFENCKIGDMVICNTSFEDLPQKGWKGKVAYLSPFLGIEWEKPFDFGHFGRGFVKEKAIETNKKYREYIYDEGHSSMTYNVSILDIYKEQLEFDF